MAEFKLLEPIFYNSCTCCSTGKGTNTKEMILAQVEKHGEFICLDCETKLEKMLTTKEKILIDGKQALITDESVYYFERPRIAAPGTSFLGFGGSWWIVRYIDYSKEYNRYTTEITNNLFHAFRIPKPYQEKFRKANRVDAHVLYIEKRNLHELNEILNTNQYLKKEAAK